MKFYTGLQKDVEKSDNKWF